MGVVRNLELVQRLAAATAAVDADHRVLPVALEVVCEHLGAAGGTVWEPLPGGGRWAPTACYDPDRGGAAPPVGGDHPGALPDALSSLLATATPAAVWCAASPDAGPGGTHPGATVSAAAVVGDVRTPAAILQIDAVPTRSDGHVLTVLCETVGQLAAGALGRLAELAEREAEAVRRSTHDRPTGLPGRTAFQRHLQDLLDAHDAPRRVAVAVVDVDRLAAVAGRLDRDAQDVLVRQIAGRLTAAVPPEATVGRLATDEFAVATAAGRRAGSRAAAELGRRIVDAFGGLFELPGAVQQLGASVGVATDATGAESADDLLRDAALAVELAKARGGRCWQLFGSEHRDQALRRLALEADLRQAVGRADLNVLFQPFVSLTSGRMVGLEALVRWDRPGHGPVPPDQFVPVAEDLGLAHQLGAHVLLIACERAAAWQREFPGAGDLTVAVNLCPLQLDDPGIVQTVEEALARSGLAPACLTLEVTESALPRDAPAALARLWELRRRGVRIAIDDFGTGYSTLSRLRKLPVDVLKIDRSFLADVGRDAPILRALVSMASTLDLEVVAEGVETPAQLHAVMGLGCGRAQGFLFSQPLAADAVARLLADPAWDLDVASPSAAEMSGAGSSGAGTAAEPSPVGRFDALLDALHGGAGPERFEQLLDDLLAALVDATGMDSVYLTRIDLDGGRQDIEAAVNRGDVRIPTGESFDWSDTICRRALTDDRPVMIDVSSVYPDLEDVADELGVTTYVSVPVTTASGDLHGTLCAVAARPRAVHEDTVQLLHHVAQLLADHLVIELPAADPAQQAPG